MVLLADLAASVGQVIVGMAFLYAGVLKLRDLDGARIGVLDYRLAPAWLAALLAPLLGAAEVLVGGGLLVGVAAAVPIGLVLLAGLSAVAGSALVRGLRIECHCFSAGERLSGATLARNACMAAGLVAAFVLRPIDGSLLVPQFLIVPLPYVVAVGFAVATVGAIVATLQFTRWSIVFSRR